MFLFYNIFVLLLTSKSEVEAEIENFTNIPRNFEIMTFRNAWLRSASISVTTYKNTSLYRRVMLKYKEPVLVKRT